MCGRFTLSVTGEVIREHYRLQEEFDWEPRYNIPPGEEIPAVGLGADGETLGIHPFRWGLIPHWSDGPDEFTANLINARSETVASKPAFRDSFRKRRCLIPTTGFYEWAETEDGKQPYFIGPGKREMFSFAGVWDRWESDDGEEELLSCAILTTRADENVKDIHDRMPVIMGPDQYGRWLDPEDAETMLEAMVENPAPGDLEMYPVDPKVNRPDYDEPECLEPVG